MRLRCTSGPIASKVVELGQASSIVFGREENAAFENFLFLPSASVSRKHGEFSYENGKYIVRDLGSSNGIRVNRTKITEAVISPRDIIQIGEFTFVAEAEQTNSKEMSVKTDKKSPAPTPPMRPALSALKEQAIHGKLKEGLDRFHRLDFKLRTLVLFGIAGILIHLISTTAMISEARDSLFRESFEIARRAVRSLGDRNKRELAEGSNFLLDCDFLKQSMGVKSAYLFDAKGKVVCPIGKEVETDWLLEGALFRGEASDNCQSRVIESGESDCDFVFPIREWRDQQAQYVTVGVARLIYQPTDAERAVQNLRALALRILFLISGILLLLWWFTHRWLAQGIVTAAEGVHSAITGASEGIASLESFAAFDPLLQEINRLIAKSNQQVSSNSRENSSEASFLQPLFQQVLLLEERPMMIVSKDNHLLGSSHSLSEVIPVDVSQINGHIIDAIGDSHLQGEIMGLLNDLSQTNEVIDRALSLADRVVQVRGMPLFLREDYVASILIF